MNPHPTPALRAAAATLAAGLLGSVSLLAQSATQIDLRGMGFVTGIIAHPQVDHLLYARTDVGGVYKWDASQNRWANLTARLTTDPRFVANIESVAVDPTNTARKGRLFIAAGSYVHDGAGPNAILRSDDYGATWTFTNFPSSVEMGGNNHWRWTGERLAVDPRNSDYVYFGSRKDGLWRSTDGGMNWTAYPDSTVPFGDSGGYFWNKQSSTPESGGVAFVAIDPRPGQTFGSPARAKNLFAGVIGAGVFRSTDGGSTWSSITGSSGPGSSAFPRLNPVQGRVASDGSLYVTSEPDKDVSGGGKVWRFQSGAWTDITPPTSLTWSSRSWVALASDPLNPARIAVADTNNFVRDIFVSSDRGATWTILTSDSNSGGFYTGKAYRPLTYTVPPWWNAQFRSSLAGGLAFQPGLDGSGANRLWAANGWGVFRSPDIAANPVALDAAQVMKGLEEFVVTRVHAFPDSAPRKLAATVMDQVGFMIGHDGAVPTTRIGGSGIEIGTGFAVSAGSPSRLYVAAKANAGASGFLRRSNDGGVTWTTLSDPNNSFGGHLAVSATNPDRVFWVPENANGTRPPIRSLDGGATWQAASGLPSTQNGSFPTINAYWPGQVTAADGVHGSKYYLYHYSNSGGTLYKGAFYRSTDSGLTWTRVNSSQIPQDYRIWVRTEAGFADEVWISAGGTHLAYSRDAGSTFTQVPNIAPKLYALGPKLNSSQSAPTAYVLGTANGRFGIHRSTDRGASWTQIALPDDVPLGDLTGIAADPSDPSVLFLGSGGQGIFRVASAPALRVSAVGAATDLAASWRNSSVPKAHDPDADNRYGEAGSLLFATSASGATGGRYVWGDPLAANHPQSATLNNLPSWLAVASAIAGNDAYAGDYGYFTLDHPGGSGSLEAGYVLLRNAVTSTTPLFRFTVGAGAPARGFRLGVMVGGCGGDFTSLTVSVGAASYTQPTETSNWTCRLHFFDIVGAKTGDVVVLSGVGGAGLAGFTVDPL